MRDQCTLGIVDNPPLTPEQIKKRRATMQAFVGIRKDRTDLPDTETYIRNLRSGERLERLMKQWRRENDD